MLRYGINPLMGHGYPGTAWQASNIKMLSIPMLARDTDSSMSVVMLLERKLATPLSGRRPMMESRGLPDMAWQGTNTKAPSITIPAKGFDWRSSMTIGCRALATMLQYGTNRLPVRGSQDMA